MKTELPLTKIPMVNGEGHNLSVCDRCFGSGTHNLATRHTKTERGDLKTEVQNLTPAQMKGVKRLKKDGWQIESSKCATCKGAGTVLSARPSFW